MICVLGRLTCLMFLSLTVNWMISSIVPHSVGAQDASAEQADAKQASGDVKPLRILLATGGGHHDYNTQSKILKEGIEERLNCEVTVIKSDEVNHPAFHGVGWAKGYDYVIHNLCNSANTDDPEQVKVITDAHKSGTPAAVIHCSMHCYRPGGPHEYQKFLGVVSRAHERHHPIKVTRNAENAKHPVMAGFPESWMTPQGELYRVLQVMPNVTELANGVASEEKVHMCYWVHQYGDAKVFGTTIGHHNETMREPVYLDTLARGILWGTGKINEDGSPKTGYGRTLK